MAVKTSLPRAEKLEITDHRDNTAKDMIKTYTLAQLSFMDWIDTRTIKASPKYLPVRVDNADTAYRYSKGRLKKPYQIRYIRLDEIKFIFNKRTKKKLVIES